MYCSYHFVLRCKYVQYVYVSGNEPFVTKQFKPVIAEDEEETELKVKSRLIYIPLIPTSDVLHERFTQVATCR